MMMASNNYPIALYDRNNQKFTPKYKDLKFPSRELFRKWLQKHCTAVIEFKNSGQDCLRWYIDKGGEVLHANSQGQIWNGKIVDLDTLIVGETVGVINSEKMCTEFYKFWVMQIRKMRPNEKA